MISDCVSLVAGLRGLGLAELANLAGLLVALAGIGFTAVQLVLLRRQLRLDALIQIMDSNREIVGLGIEHSAVWSAIDEPAASGVDARTRRHYLQLWVNHMLIMWMAWRLGLVSGVEWEAYGADMADFLRSPSLQAHWAAVSRFYPASFRGVITALLPGPSGASPGGEG
jgi:hypothetical protein